MFFVSNVYYNGDRLDLIALQFKSTEGGKLIGCNKEYMFKLHSLGVTFEVYNSIGGTYESYGFFDFYAFLERYFRGAVDFLGVVGNYLVVIPVEVFKLFDKIINIHDITKPDLAACIRTVIEGNFEYSLEGDYIYLYLGSGTYCEMSQVSYKRYKDLKRDLFKLKMYGS